MKPDFQFFQPNFFYCRSKLKKNQYFWKIYFCWEIFDHKNNKTKIEHLASWLCAEFHANSKSVFVFVLALIVFDFYSFEISKINTQKNIKILFFFLKTIPKIQKFSRTKCNFFFYFTYSVLISAGSVRK